MMENKFKVRSCTASQEKEVADALGYISPNVNTPPHVFWPGREDEDAPQLLDIFSAIKRAERIGLIHNGYKLVGAWRANSSGYNGTYTSTWWQGVDDPDSEHYRGNSEIFTLDMLLEYAKSKMKGYEVYGMD